MMKIAYVTQYDARDRRNYAGIPFYMSKALSEVPGVDLAYVGPLREYGALLSKVTKLFYLVAARKEYHRSCTPYILRGYAQQVVEALQTLKPDLVVTPTSMPIAYLDTDTPVVLWTDATFAGLVNFYPGFKNLSAQTLREGHQMQRGTLEHSTLAVYSSEWAARSAIKEYGGDPDRVKVVPYGANLDAEPEAAEVETAIMERPTDRCRLLLVGVNWERKGGPKAVKVAQALNDAGLPTELTIIGCTSTEPVPPFVQALGFIPKNTPEGRQQLRQAWTDAHFLILPSEADCTPIVLCEACAFGVPCLTTDVGGINTTIRKGRNGIALPLDAPATAYRDYVLDLFNDPAHYQALARSARAEYETRLSWPAAVTGLLALIEEQGLIPAERIGR